MKHIEQMYGELEERDVLVYLLRDNGFMNGTDIECLHRAIPALPYLETRGLWIFLCKR
jgi:hypothetical protein